MKTTIKNGNQKLNCYASGSGALSFVWSGVEHPYTATGKTVTMQHVERFLNLRANKGKFQWHNVYKYRAGHIELVPDVKRIDAQTISYKGTNYRYEMEGDVINYRTLKFFCTIMFGFDETTREELEVKHIATRLALVFFMKNEKTVYANSRSHEVV